MEYEQWERSGSTSSDQAPGSPFLPTIDESNVLDIRDPKEKLLKMLDKVEARVELLRKDTARIEEEKDTLLAALDAIKHCEWMLDLNEFDREDVQLTLRRILDRCSTVEARVYTIRDPEQEESLNQVNQCIDSLIVCVREDPISAHIRCQSFMNACSQSQVSDSPNRQSISVDSYFESVILGCALDDQKRVKKRLQGLLDYFARLNIQTAGQLGWFNTGQAPLNFNNFGTSQSHHDPNFIVAKSFLPVLVACAEKLLAFIK